MCLHGVVLIEFIVEGRHSLEWKALFPRLGALKCIGVENSQ